MSDNQASTGSKKKFSESDRGGGKREKNEPAKKKIAAFLSTTQSRRRGIRKARNRSSLYLARVRSHRARKNKSVALASCGGEATWRHRDDGAAAEKRARAEKARRRTSSTRTSTSLCDDRRARPTCGADRPCPCEAAKQMSFRRVAYISFFFLNLFPYLFVKFFSISFSLSLSP